MAQAYDHGEPQQESSEIYQLVIRPYNFHAPEFVFPQNDALVRFARVGTFYFVVNLNIYFYSSNISEILPLVVLLYSYFAG